MKGIYIKGMKMPSECRLCPLESDFGTCGYYDFYGKLFCESEIEKRRDDCPLIEVPEHGRLIDADALILPPNLNDWNSISDYVRNITNIWATIDNAKTIIPPDEEET